MPASSIRRCQERNTPVYKRSSAISRNQFECPPFAVIRIHDAGSDIEPPQIFAKIGDALSAFASRPPSVKSTSICRSTFRGQQRNPVLSPPVGVTGPNLADLRPAPPRDLADQSRSVRCSDRGDRDRLSRASPDRSRRLLRGPPRQIGGIASQSGILNILHPIDTATLFRQG